MERNKHRGPTLESFLVGEGVHEELKSIVAKEAIAWQLQQAMEQKGISKNSLA